MKRIFAYLIIALLTAATAYLGWRVHSDGNTELAGHGDSGASSTVAPALRIGPATRKSPVPHLVRQLVDPSKHLEEQIELVRALPDDLTPEEFAALIDLLRDPSPPKTSPSQWYVLLNEIMEVLRQPRFTWEGYSASMAALVADRNADPVMRDYATQHLVLYLCDRAGQLPEESVTTALDTLLGVLTGGRESHEMVCGTTLMAVCDLDSRHPELLAKHRGDLGTSVLALVSGERPASMSNQIAAIQAAGRMGFTEALPAIRGYAVGDAPNPSAKLSSIAALGYFAEPEDIAFLTELAQGDGKLRFAARSALKNYSRN